MKNPIFSSPVIIGMGSGIGVGFGGLAQLILSLMGVQIGFLPLGIGAIIGPLVGLIIYLVHRKKC